MKKVLVAVAVALPLVTFGTASGPAGAIPPGKPVCFFANGPTGSIAIMNLTPVLANGPGNGQLVPINLYKNPPKASNVNFGPGTVDPNVAFSRIGTVQTVCFANSRNASVDVIADHLGSIKSGAWRAAKSNGAPKRVLNTKTTRKIAANSFRCFSVSGRPGDYAVVNLTPILASGSSDGLLVSSNQRRKPPKGSNVNYSRNSVDPNVAITKIGSDGKVCFVARKGASLHLIADHLGSIKASAYRPAKSNGAPNRVLDTRKRGGKIKRGSSRCMTVSGSPGDYAVVNLTPVEATGAGDGQLVSSNLRRNPPKGSHVNYNRGTVNPNIGVAQIGNDNRVCFVASKAAVNLIADHLGTIKQGAFVPARSSGAQRRALDTRFDAEVTPISWSGPAPARASQVNFACGHVFGIITRRVVFTADPRVSPHRFRITFLNDPFPQKGSRDYVINESVNNMDIISAVVTVKWYDNRLPYRENWVQRVKIEKYIGTQYESSAVFDVADKCENAILSPEIVRRAGDDSPTLLGANDEPVVPTKDNQQGFTFEVNPGE